MSDDMAFASVPFDLERLKELIQLMEEHDLSEVDLHNGDRRCRLRRGPQGGMPALTAPYPMMIPGGPPPAPASGGAAAAAAAASAHDGTSTINSPTVGTFYAAASPDDPPFVNVGMQVEPDTVVCLIEAMKVYNQITADTRGIVTEILVANGDAVEFGQPLFRVRPS